MLLPEPPTDGRARATRAGEASSVPQCHVLEVLGEGAVPQGAAGAQPCRAAGTGRAHWPGHSSDVAGCLELTRAHPR